jgi:cytochrome P450
MAIVTEIFHTGAMPQKTRLQYWNRVANTAFGAMHIEPVSSSAQGAGLNDIINSAWKDALICMDPPKHTEMSKLFTDRIGPRHLKDVEQTIHVRAKELAQRLQQNREFDGISDVAYDLSLNVISTSSVGPKRCEANCSTMRSAVLTPAVPMRRACTLRPAAHGGYASVHQQDLRRRQADARSNPHNKAEVIPR